MNAQVKDREVKDIRRLAQTSSVPQGKYGVLLMNMGGPGKTEDIVDYLYNVFSDPLILPLPGFLRKPLAFLISRLRKKEAASRYDLIGGKSPLDEETQKQAQALSRELRLPVTYAMRYIRPTVDQACKILKGEGVDRLITLPLYPQFSRVTSQTALDNLKEKGGWGPQVRIISNHYSDPAFIDGLSELLNQSLKTIDPERKTAMLFVAHSVPMEVVEKGDPYVEQVKATVELMAEKNKWQFPYSVAFQSKVGPVKWQGPSLTEELERLKKEGVNQLVVQPVSFVCENLETMFDLDIELKEDCDKAGIRLVRVPAQGTHPRYIGALASLVRHEIAQWEDQNA